MLLGAFYHTILAVLFTFVAILLMGVVLLQRGRGVGLAGAFGGAGGHTAFGAKTGDFLTWATIFVAAFLLICAIVLNYIFRPEANPLGAAAPTPPPITQPISTEETAPPAAEPLTAPEDTPAAQPPAAETPADSPAPTTDTDTSGTTEPGPAETPADEPPVEEEAPQPAP